MSARRSRVARSCSFQTAVVDAQQLLGVQTGRDRVLGGGDQRLSAVEVREERSGALVVELAEHVVEEQDRRCARDVGAETMAGQPQRERERALLTL